jgi:plastocyanin
MIWRWVISFNLAFGALGAAVVTGRVDLRDSRVGDVSSVVIWLRPVSGAPASRPSRAVMVQRGKKFIPHVLAVQKGTAVDFPNNDPIFHNAFSNYSGQIFDVGLYKPGTSRTVTFSRPGVVRIFCNIHANMSAVIVVLDTPWFATTDKDGNFRIDDVPPGEYTLEAFHERATPEELSKASRAVQVAKAEVALAPVVISETGYLPAPHLNKYGKPYSAQAESYKVLR